MFNDFSWVSTICELARRPAMIWQNDELMVANSGQKRARYLHCWKPYLIDVVIVVIFVDRVVLLLLPPTSHVHDLYTHSSWRSCAPLFSWPALLALRMTKNSNWLSVIISVCEISLAITKLLSGRCPLAFCDFILGERVSKIRYYSIYKNYTKAIC